MLCLCIVLVFIIFMTILFFFVLACICMFLNKEMTFVSPSYLVVEPLLSMLLDAVKHSYHVCCTTSLHLLFSKWLSI